MDTDVRSVLVDSWQAMVRQMAGGKLGAPALQPPNELEQVFHTLSDAPWIAARDVADDLGLDRDRVLLAYKCLQRAEGLGDHFRKGIHSDYFNVVRHYFNSPFYTLVFFVGTTCPSRCSFCPNVTVHGDGRRSLATFGEGMRPLGNAELDAMFHELDRLKSTGTGLLVKISGGLEPMTDVETLSRIAGRASTLGVPVKLFTNGILLNTEKRRRAALMTGDIRISLSTTLPLQYESINFGKRRPRLRMRMDHLNENLRELVRLRDRMGSPAKIGLNSIIMPANCDQVIPLMKMARGLGLDYIDFKPDYFGLVSDEDQSRIMESVDRATELSQRSHGSPLYVHFAGAIRRDHLYWKSWNGVCDAVQQARYKMFVTPFGHLSPIHYGAFPHSHEQPEAELSRWAVGRLTGKTRFLDVLARPEPIPEVPWSCLNPFELMLSLEIEREASDRAWGIPVSCSPYHTSRRDEIPGELVDAWKRGGGAHAL